MGWENEKLSRTLYMTKEKQSDGTVKRYTIYPMMKVERDNGQTYLEPLPFEMLAAATRFALKFDRIEFIEPPSVRRDADAGALHLTNFGADYGVLRTAIS